MLLYEKLELDTEKRKRLFNHYSCDYCSIEYKRQKRFSGSKQEHYCSAKCYNTDNIRIEVQCAHCGIMFKKQPSKIQNSKSGLHFCCRDHKDQAQRYLKDIQPAHYNKGKSNYRNLAFSYYGKICSNCQYDNEYALEVHHIDKDRSNNNINNLKVLCSNCHTLIHKGKL